MWGWFSLVLGGGVCYLLFSLLDIWGVVAGLGAFDGFLVWVALGVLFVWLTDWWCVVWCVVGFSFCGCVGCASCDCGLY